MPNEELYEIVIEHLGLWARVNGYQLKDLPGVMVVFKDGYMTVEGDGKHIALDFYEIPIIALTNLSVHDVKNSFEQQFKEE